MKKKMKGYKFRCITRLFTPRAVKQRESCIINIKDVTTDVDEETADICSDVSACVAESPLPSEGVSWHTYH